jgi:hypothetical protein
MVKCKVVNALVLVIFLYGLYGCKSKEESRKATKEKVLSGVKANNTSLNVSIHEETLNGQTDQVINSSCYFRNFSLIVNTNIKRTTFIKNPSLVTA